MKTITKKELVKLVKTEIENIKKFATKEQKEKLSYYYFLPTSMYECIYGQLGSGYCFSEEAKKLIKKCAKGNVFFETILDNMSDENFNRAIKIVTLKPVLVDKGKPFNQRYFTPLEFYISLKRSKEKYNYNILEYIKGGRKTLYLD